MKHLEWFGCYADSWQGEIVPEAFSHPAKFSRGLIARIYDHMLDSGYIKPGDTVGDPFGGVALGAIHAMLEGLHWRGVELEAKFVDLGGQNIALWQLRYGELLRGTAVLAQGDSRQFVRHIAGIDGVVSSSPFVGVMPSQETVEWHQARHSIGKNNSLGKSTDYGQPPGQLGAMPEGDLSAVVSSPAYADVVSGAGEGPGARFDHVYHNGENATKQTSQAAYGRTAGNLGNLAGVVSSAPFEKSQEGGGIGAAFRGESNYPLTAGQGGRYQGYLAGHQGQSDGQLGNEQGSTFWQSDGQLGNEQGSTFWQAAAEIVAQAYAALKPGAYAAWVCGDYVRDGQRVYFGRQWLELCESVGFVPVEWATAWKTEYKGNQLDIFGNDHEKRIDRVSFFRRLANERNPDAAILNEDVIIVKKQKEA